MTAVLEIRLFGGLQIQQEMTPVIGFVSNKVSALLLYLAVTRRTHQRDSLAALLWGEMAEADARNNLRQALANLRKLVDPYLVISRESAAFNTAAPYRLDIFLFEEQLQIARSQTEEGRALAWQEAGRLYQGDFLAGFVVREAPMFEEWLLAQRVRYRELALHTLHNLTDYHLSHGQYGRAIDCATRLLALDAWREEAHRQLMLAQLRSGQRSAALAQYDICCRLLASELGASPSAETTALYERIRGAVHQVRLPPVTTSFVGRGAELEQIARRLADPTCHLLTLCGAGGSGKTRLAQEAASRQAQIFMHGVCFVPLAAVETLDVVPSAVVQALGITLGGTGNPQEELLAHLKDKELLLVLDNLEHLPAAQLEAAMARGRSLEIGQVIAALSDQ